MLAVKRQGLVLIIETNNEYPETVISEEIHFLIYRERIYSETLPIRKSIYESFSSV